MIDFKPFKAIRPVADKVHLVASRSYVSYARKALASKLDENPYTFIHIINPEYNKPGRKSSGLTKFRKVRERFLDFVSEGVYFQDQTDCFYLYRQVQQIPGGKTFTGWIGGASVQDYLNKKIKIHEHTITSREEMFRQYLEVTGFNAEPVLIAHPHSEDLLALRDEIIQSTPSYDFTSTNRDRHQLWKVSDPKEIQAIQTYFSEFDASYIADGHHRSASSVLLAQDKIDNPSAQHFLACFIDEAEMAIYDFNRLIKDAGGLSSEILIKLIVENQIDLTPCELETPLEPGSFKLYTPEGWYLGKFPEDTLGKRNPVEALEAHQLSEFVLGPIFDIIDLRTDKRVFFKGGRSGHIGLQNSVDKGEADFAFALPAVTIEDLKRVADAGLCMPPKSTYIEPKLRSGMTIYPIEKNLVSG